MSTPQLDQAKQLVRSAIQAGILNDLGSGHNIDLCVITDRGVDYIRPYQESQYKDHRYRRRRELLCLSRDDHRHHVVTVSL